MKAVIMAGGEGTRLRPLTSNLPKPMMPLANRPMMEHVVGLLRRYGFDEIVVTVAYLADSIRNYFGDGSDFGVQIAYTTEDTPLGTAGSVGNARHLLEDTFLVISGDVLTDIDLGGLLDVHRSRRSQATIALTAVANPLEFGIVITREDGSIDRFLEKPSWGQVFSDTINTGIFVLEPQIFDWIPEGGSVDFSGDVFPKLLAAGFPMFGHVAKGYWEDIGTHDAYVRAHKDVLDGSVVVSVPGFRVGDGIWLGEGTEVHPRARLEAPVVIGDNCRVDDGVRLGPYTVLGANVKVRADADLEMSVVHDHSYLGAGVRLRGAVVGRSCDLRRGARLEEGVVLGDECFVGEHALLNPGIKVFPFKTIEDGAIVNSSIVFESRGARSLFGRNGVAGLANVDITPEMAVKVAMAYASTLKRGARVTTSRDTSRTARMLKRALMAGLNAAGIDVSDLEVASEPVTRFQVRTQRDEGGITVRLAGDDPQKVEIRFFDDQGADLAESAQRKVERVFQREDYRRVLAGEIGDIGYAPRAIEFYTAALTQVVDFVAVQEASFKVVVDYAYGSTAFVMPNVLAKLGADVLAVNPYASTARSATFELDEHLAHLSPLVTSSGAQLGAVIHPNGDRASFVDDLGRSVSPQALLHTLIELRGAHGSMTAVALPVATSSQIARTAERHGVQVIWTKLNPPALCQAAAESNADLAGSPDGGVAVPSFLPAFDGTATFSILLESLALDGRRLSQIVDGLAPVHLVHETVVTPWDQKGAVMRTLVESSTGREVILIDGVKVFHPEGWVLALPDPEDPVTHVWAEGDDAAAARRLVDEYVRRICQLVR